MSTSPSTTTRRRNVDSSEEQQQQQHQQQEQDSTFCHDDSASASTHQTCHATARRNSCGGGSVLSQPIVTSYKDGGGGAIQFNLEQRQHQQEEEDDNWSVSTSNYSIVSGLSNLSKLSKASKKSNNSSISAHSIMSSKSTKTSHSVKSTKSSLSVLSFSAISHFSQITLPGQASRRHKSLASVLAALVVLVICTFAVRSCGDGVMGHVASGSAAAKGGRLRHLHPHDIGGGGAAVAGGVSVPAVDHGVNNSDNTDSANYDVMKEGENGAVDDGGNARGLRKSSPPEGGQSAQTNQISGTKEDGDDFLAVPSLTQQQQQLNMKLNQTANEKKHHQGLVGAPHIMMQMGETSRKMTNEPNALNYVENINSNVVAGSEAENYQNNRNSSSNFTNGVINTVEFAEKAAAALKRRLQEEEEELLEMTFNPQPQQQDQQQQNAQDVSPQQQQQQQQQDEQVQSQEATSQQQQQQPQPESQQSPPQPDQLQQQQHEQQSEQQQNQQPNNEPKLLFPTPLSRFRNPVTIKTRSEAPLDLSSYQINPLLRPDGYPWHRWVKPPEDSSLTYPLNTTKFVHILSRLGRGENQLGTVSPQQYTWQGVPIDGSTIRMSGNVRPFLVRDGTVLRPDSSSGMFVTFVQMALEKAKNLADQDPRMKLLAEGDFPIIFDSNDYPWCGEDFVPVFRLNAIKSMNCMHSWPTLSLTYFGDPNNVQMYATPYQWDEEMEKWDEMYPWEKKTNQVVWRGRITGYTYPDGDRPRGKLVQYAKNFLDIMNIKPVTENSKMKQDDFMKFKAILDIDGNAWSARLGKLLCYNSVVVKVEPEYIGYWEKELHPWVHYIPVKSDLSDFENVIRYVMAPENSDQMRQVIKNAQNFCRTKLTFEQYTVDLLWTLLAYAELLTGSPDFMTEWRKDEDAYFMPALNMGVRTVYTLPF
mmetsp:Transcript_24187/g.51048  ORF Transcript_24187/g.51048 Transcript_24187/m.51048 type:complete len:926 (+) Transcript_24187:247-3024(+)